MLGDQAKARNQTFPKFAELPPYASMRGALEGRGPAVTSDDGDIDEH